MVGLTYLWAPLCPLLVCLRLSGDDIRLGRLDLLLKHFHLLVKESV